MADAPTSIPILRTKLHRPPIPADLVPRARVLERLEHGLWRPLTLVSASAGYGNSTVLSHWLEVCDRAGAWVSLDEGDNDLRLFSSYFVAAVQTLFPAACRQTQALLEAANLPPLSVLATTLINELDSVEQEFILVLDDVHLIRDPAVHDLLAHLLRHPPAPMHLVLAGRRDPALPVSGLRARDQVNEVRVQDLRFSIAETVAFLRHGLKIDVDEETATLVEEGTEGWVTALRLVALSARHRGSIDRLAADLRANPQYVREYLFDEVLSAQTPAVRDYLLTSSILDRFCAALCTALTGREAPGGEPGADGDEWDFITRLERENLFLVPLDGEGRWFRYHHLFQQLLRNQLERYYSREEIPALHSRASEWFEAEGLVDEAFQHAVAAGNVEMAVQVVERHARPMMSQNKKYLPEKWIAQLPREVVWERPLLLWAQAWGHYYRMDIAALPAVMDRVDELMGGAAEAHAFSAELATFRGLCAMLQNEGACALQYVEQALALTGPAPHQAARALAELLFGLAGQMEGQGDRVTRALNGWLADPSLRDPARETNLAQTLVFISYISADPAGVEALLQRGRRVAESSDLKSLAPWNDYLDGLFHLQRGELGAALQLLEKAGKGKHFHHVRGAVDAMCARVLAYQAHGKPVEAAAALRSIDEFIGDNRRSFRPLSDSCAARLALMQGQSESAVRWLEHGAPPPVEVMVFWFEIPCVTWCRALIAEGSAASLREAEERLREHAAMNEAHHNTCQLIGILTLQAMACDKQGKAEQVRAVLGRALTLARPGGFIFPFLELGLPMANLLKRLQKQNIAVDHVDQLLSSFPSPVSPSPRPLSASPALQPLVEPLTTRELDVLELLAQRFRNKEIAEKLVISPETVKGHLKNLYQKLNAGDRREAVAKATALGILSGG